MKIKGEDRSHLLEPIDRAIKRLETLAVDLEWEGRDKDAMVIRQSLRPMQIAREQGERYVAKF